MTSYTAITTSEVDADSPITESLMTRLRDNPIAITEGSSGAPKIQTAAYDTGSVDQAAIGASAVGQAELKTATDNQFTVISGNDSAGVLMTGGTYTMVNGVGSTQSSQGFSLGRDDDTGNDEGTWWVNNQSSSQETFYSRARYIQASPPYNLGDGDIPLFVYLLMGSDGIHGASVAPDPMWAYHGPTDIRAQQIDRVTGRQYRTERILPNGMTPMQAKYHAPEIYQQFMRCELSCDTQVVEVDQAFKNRDMNIVPHPWVRNKLSGRNIVLLDPVCRQTERLAEMHEEGEDLVSIIETNHFVIDNTDNGRITPNVVMPVNFRWKNRR